MKKYVIVLISLTLSALSLHAADDWTQKTPSPKPSGRYRHGIAYIGGDQVLLFGGKLSGSDYNNETWDYDLSANTWTNKNPSSAPSARYTHTKTYIGGYQHE